MSVAAHQSSAGRVNASSAVPTVSSRENGVEFAGSHPAHVAALRSIEALAPYEHATILIEGESGTGKSYAARLSRASCTNAHRVPAPRFIR